MLKKANTDSFRVSFSDLHEKKGFIIIQIRQNGKCKLMDVIL